MATSACAHGLSDVNMVVLADVGFTSRDVNHAGFDRNNELKEDQSKREHLRQLYMLGKLLEGGKAKCDHDSLFTSVWAFSRSRFPFCPRGLTMAGRETQMKNSKCPELWKPES